MDTFSKDIGEWVRGIHCLCLVQCAHLSISDHQQLIAPNVLIWQTILLKAKLISIHFPLSIHLVSKVMCVCVFFKKVYLGTLSRGRGGGISFSWMELTTRAGFLFQTKKSKSATVWVSKALCEILSSWSRRATFFSTYSLSELSFILAGFDQLRPKSLTSPPRGLFSPGQRRLPNLEKNRRKKKTSLLLLPQINVKAFFEIHFFVMTRVLIQEIKNWGYLFFLIPTCRYVSGNQLYMRGFSRTKYRDCVGVTSTPQKYH